MPDNFGAAVEGLAPFDTDDRFQLIVQGTSLPDSPAFVGWCAINDAGDEYGYRMAVAREGGDWPALASLVREDFESWNLVGVHRPVN